MISEKERPSYLDSDRTRKIREYIANKAVNAQDPWFIARIHSKSKGTFHYSFTAPTRIAAITKARMWAFKSISKFDNFDDAVEYELTMKDVNKAGSVMDFTIRAQACDWFKEMC